MRFKDLTGQTFNRLTITGRHASKGYWVANCACGSTDVVVRGTSLTSGNTKSCGCLRKQNKGRPRVRSNSPFIDFNDMLMSTIDHIGPIRHYLKGQGVTVTKDALIYIDGKKFGPYKSPYHALAVAIQRCVKGMHE